MKRNLKQVADVMLIIVMLATLFTGCGNSEANNASLSTGTPAENVTAPAVSYEKMASTSDSDIPCSSTPPGTSSSSIPNTAAPPAQAEPQVTDCFTFVRSDYVSGLEEWEQYEIHIPEIQLPGNYSAVNSINREIKEKYLADGEAWAADPVNANGVRDYGSIQYEWYHNDDVLSLVVAASFCHYEYLEYQVYNVSTSTGQQLSNSELVSRAGWAESSYQSSVKEVLLSQYWDKVGPALVSLESSGNLTEERIEYYRNLYEETISFVQEAIPFLGENGDLYIVGRFSVDAGGGSESCRINLNSYSVSPYYSEEFIAPNIESGENNSENTNQTVWRLVSSEREDEALIINEFSYDETGNLADVTTECIGNSVVEGWSRDSIYHWEESEQCLAIGKACITIPQDS